MHVHGQELSRSELRRRTGSTRSVGGVRRVVLDDGGGRGVRLLEFRTAAGLAFDVVVDRGMDISAASFSGQSFGWHSGVGVRHPGLHTEDEGGWGFLRSFDGLLVTGGLDHAFAPAETDGSHFRYAGRSTLNQPLHGRLHQIPSTLLGSGETWTRDRCILWAEAETRQVAVFGENLLVRRRVEVDLDGDEIRVSDVVMNDGYDPSTHMYLYHVNLGWPLVSEGTRLVAAIERTVWESPSAGQQDQPYDVLRAPRPGVREQVYQHAITPAPDGAATAGLVRADRSLAVFVSWDTATMPHLVQWLHLREGAYAVGLEPSTHGPGGAPGALADGSLTWLAPGESRSYWLRIRASAGADDVEELERSMGAPARPSA